MNSALDDFTDKALSLPGALDNGMGAVATVLASIGPITDGDPSVLNAVEAEDALRTGRYKVTPFDGQAANDFPGDSAAATARPHVQQHPRAGGHDRAPSGRRCAPRRGCAAGQS